MKTPFVISKNEVYIKVSNCGIHPLILASDGAHVVTFGRGKTPYIRVDDAVKWYESEIPHAKTDREKAKYRAAVDSLSWAKDTILRGAPDSERKNCWRA